MTVKQRHPLGITVVRESTNEDGVFRRFSSFPDRSDFRLREFKMAATGKRLTCIQTVLSTLTGGGFVVILLKKESDKYCFTYVN